MSRRSRVAASALGLVFAVWVVLLVTQAFDRGVDGSRDGATGQTKSPRELSKAATKFRGDIAELEAMREAEGGTAELPNWARAAVTAHEDREAFLDSLIGRWESGELPDWAIKYFIAEWAVVDSDGALAAVEKYSRLPHEPGGWSTPATYCGRLIAQTVSTSDRERIWLELLAAENSQLNREVLAGFVQADLIEDPEAGIARLDSIPDERRHRGSEIKFAYELAIVAPALLPDFLANRSSEAQEYMSMAAPGIGLRLAIYYEKSGDLDTVLQVLPQLPETIQDFTMPRLIAFGVHGGVLESFAQWERIAEDFASAGGRDYSNRVLEMHVRRGGGKLVRSLDLEALSSEQVVTVAGAYAYVAPAPAFRWARGLPDSEINQQILREVVQSWSRSEPIAASRAVAGMPEGPRRTAVAEIVREEAADREEPDLDQRVAEVLGRTGDGD